VQIGERERLEHGAGLAVVGVGLPWKSGDDVGPKAKNGTRLD
jgi:hypothetical protein